MHRWLQKMALFFLSFHFTLIANETKNASLEQKSQSPVLQVTSIQPGGVALTPENKIEVPKRYVKKLHFGLAFHSTNHSPWGDSSIFSGLFTDFDNFTPDSFNYFYHLSVLTGRIPLKDSRVNSVVKRLESYQVHFAVAYGYGFIASKNLLITPFLGVDGYFEHSLARNLKEKGVVGDAEARSLVVSPVLGVRGIYSLNEQLSLGLEFQIISVLSGSMSMLVILDSTDYTAKDLLPSSNQVKPFAYPQISLPVLYKLSERFGLSGKFLLSLEKNLVAKDFPSYKQNMNEFGIEAGAFLTL